MKVEFIRPIIILGPMKVEFTRFKVIPGPMKVEFILKLSLVQ